MANKKPEVPLREASGFLLRSADSTGTTMQNHVALGVHFALAIKPEGLLWLAGQCSALLLIFIKRQASTAQRFQGQLLALFGRVGTQFWRWMARTAGEYGADNQ